MDVEQIRSTVEQAVNDFVETLEDNIVVDESTILFGKEGLLDSMGLVTIIVDIESQLQELGYEVSLSSEKAMSMKNSPFQTVSSMTKFIVDELEAERD